MTRLQEWQDKTGGLSLPRKPTVPENKSDTKRQSTVSIAGVDGTKQVTVEVIDSYKASIKTTVPELPRIHNEMRRPTPTAIDSCDRRSAGTEAGGLLNRYRSQASTQPTEPENKTDMRVSESAREMRAPEDQIQCIASSQQKH
jgi:hypothetical protein